MATIKRGYQNKQCQRSIPSIEASIHANIYLGCYSGPAIVCLFVKLKMALRLFFASKL